jgi:hypothetical protein
MTARPYVLVVDDEDQEAFALQLGLYGVDARHVLPGEIDLDDMRRASLILIDEFIANWPERDGVRGQVGLFVRDGIALAGVLRSSLENRGPSHDSAPTPAKTALALRTGHLDVLAGGTPAFLRPMAVARRHDLEWAASKASTPAPALASLAKAAAALPDDWSNPAEPAAQMEWLGLADQPWRDSAIAQIEQCRPPWSVLATTSAGRRWLAWFLQRILPFPTFVVDDLRAASYLGLRPSALDVIVEGDSPLANALQGAKYTGQLSEFSGRRWWRAGITAVKAIALEHANGRMADDVARAIVAIHGADLDMLDLRHPVFEIDADYAVVGEAIEVTSAVRLQPDDWPTYADDPWYSTDSVGMDPALDALIVIDDRADGTGDEGQ